MEPADNDSLIDKLQKILALTNSPVEGEAQAAAAMLQKLLEKHNLSMAELERKGGKAPHITEGGYDLGKAGFQWKLDLAEGLAKHYYCISLVNRYQKTVVFIGRPDNVRTLEMIYGWLIDQIKRISAEERRNHLVRTGEHVDPLRWQVNFGLGAQGRLLERLEEQRQQIAESTYALVIHHESEISDYTEQKYGRRHDGQQTKAQQERDLRWDLRRAAEHLLSELNQEAYWKINPWAKPDSACTPEELARRQKADRDAEIANNRSNGSWKAAQTRKARNWWKESGDGRKADQAESANEAGRRRAADVNLQPFLETGHAAPKVKEG